MSAQPPESPEPAEPSREDEPEPREDLVEEARRKGRPASPLNDAARAERTRAFTGLGKPFAWVFVGLLTIQIAVADVVFYIYGEANDWRIPTVAITGWLLATVIQVVGIVGIVAKGLFAPLDDEHA